MEKGYPPQDSAPPYPGPPLNYGSGPGNYPQPGFAVPPPPPPGYQGGPYGPAQPAVPITTVTHVVVTPSLRDIPGQTVCPHCQQRVITRTEASPGLLTWLACAGLGFFGCFLCCCIPFCVESLQDITHRCPSCNNTIYVFNRM